MIEKVDELLEGVFKINIVFPQRVVGVDQQVLPGGRIAHRWTRGASWNGISATTSTSTGLPLRSAGSNSHLSRASAALWSSRGSTPFNTRTPFTCPLIPITPASWTFPSTRSAMADGKYLGSTLWMGTGGRRSWLPRGPAGVRSANHMIQLPT